MAYTFSYKYNITLILLGYLYFCVAINSAKSLESDASLNSAKSYTSMENCTQCLIKLHPNCLEYTDECLISCPGFSCCLCSDCTCWHDQQKAITLYKINIYILCGYAIIGMVVIYCQICKKIKQRMALASMRRTILQRDSNTSTNRTTNEIARQERPPSYNEAYEAPPLYTTLNNMRPMEEASSQELETLKLQERSRDSNDLPSLPPPPPTFSVTQHM